jgi:uncharacterized membrane protein HdeD (DUF308 family)
VRPDAGTPGVAGLETPMPPPPPRPIEYRDVDPRGWWVGVLAGAALVVLGVWLLTSPFRSVVILAALIGVSLIVSGIVEALARGGPQDLGWPAWIAGALFVATGIAVLVWPDITLWAVAGLAGVGLILAGLLGVAIALSRRERPGWPGELASAALGVLLGVVVLAWPDATLLVLAVLLGVRAVITGLIAIATGWQTHRLALT